MSRLIRKPEGLPGLDFTHSSGEQEVKNYLKIWLPQFQKPDLSDFPVFLKSIFNTLHSIIVILILSFFSGTAFADKSPQRIISMAPSITESLFALGAGDRVVGRTDFCKWPKEACQLPNVGGMLNPSTETWLTLKPDLIIFLKSSDRLASKAKSLGLKTLLVDMNRIDTIFKSWQLMGTTLGIADSATKLENSIRKEIETIKLKTRGLEKIETLLLLGDSSDPGRDLFAVGRSTFLGELIELAGGFNILEDPDANYPRISKEFILSRSPEVIIEAGPKSKLTGDEYKRRMKEWEPFASIKAVQTRRIHFIGEDYAVIPGPRLHLILKQFAKALHPDIFGNLASSTQK